MTVDTKEQQQTSGDVGGGGSTRPRGPIMAMFGSPGPCYQLKSTIGFVDHTLSKEKRPAFSFGVRTEANFGKDCSPGPVHYTNVDRMGNSNETLKPCYSLYGRPRDLKPFRPPGPGTYSPEKAGKMATGTSAPAYGFGARTQYRKEDKNPAPNAYLLPTLLGRTVEGSYNQAPMISMQGHSKVGGFHEDLAQTPAASTYSYNISCIKREAPKYSLRPRCELPGDTTQKPGPGTYSPKEAGPGTRGKSFGVRHSQYTTMLIEEVVD